MEISKVDQCRIREYNMEQRKLQDKRDEDYRKLVERRNFDNIVSERVARNIRLDLDKGRTVDIDC